MVSDHTQANQELMQLAKLIATLRQQTYGTNFASDFPANAKLIDVLHQLDEPSLTKLVHDTHGRT
jgi:hypothetical protein